MPPSGGIFYTPQMFSTLTVRGKLFVRLVGAVMKALPRHALVARFGMRVHQIGRRNVFATDMVRFSQWRDADTA